MDPVTHGIVGAGISYALFGRKLGRHAALVGLLAGIAPDVDHFVSSKEDVLLYVEVHRGVTHSILFAIIGALITVLPWILQSRFRPQWKTFWGCAFPGYLSHCLLDASTTYGTQLLWPFTRIRFGWDLIAVIDPTFTIVLAILLLIGLKKNKPVFAVAGVAFATAYLSMGGIQKWRASNVQEAIAVSRGHKIERYEVMPTIANLVVWRSLYLANGQLYSDRIRVGVFTESTYRKGNALPLLTEEAQSPLERRGNKSNRGVERFSWFSDNWLARSPFDPEVIGDMRYSISTKAFDPIWGIRFYEERDQIKLEWVNRQLKRKVNLSELGSEIAGTHPDYISVPKNAH